MKYRNRVILKKDKPEYFTLGLTKNYHWGRIKSKTAVDGKWTVFFFPEIEEFLKKEKNKDGDFLADGLFDILEEDLEIIEDNIYIDETLDCDGNYIEEYDIVELINEKETYTNKGIEVGMEGTVNYPIPHKGKWEIEFWKDDENGYRHYFPDISIKGNDLRIVK